MLAIDRALPIDSRDGLHLDLNKARELGQELSDQYIQSQPFPHIVIDNFLLIDVIDRIYSDFPTDSTDNEKLYEKGYKGLHKRQINPAKCNNYIRNIFYFFNF